MRAPSGVLLVAAAALLFSSGGLFIKLAPLPPLAVVSGRALVTVLFFVVLYRPDLRLARWSTALAYAGTVITFVVATKWTTAANAVFLQYTAPVYVLFLSPWLLKERLRARDAVFVAVALCGMALVFAGEMSPGHRAGNLMAILAGVLLALNIMLLRRDATVGHATITASTTLGAVIATVLPLPLAAGDLLAITPTGALVLLYLGLVQVGVAYALLNRGLRTVPAATASLVTMLEPVANPVWVFLGTGERPAGLALAGGALVVGAVAVRSTLRGQAL